MGQVDFSKKLTQNKLKNLHQKTSCFTHWRVANYKLLRFGCTKESKPAQIGRKRRKP